jgi:hypothetical protein
LKRGFGLPSADQIHAADYLDRDTPIDCRGKRVVIVEWLPEAIRVRLLRAVMKRSLGPVSEQQAKWLVGVSKETIELPNRARQARLSIRFSKTLPVLCHSRVTDLHRHCG